MITILTYFEPAIVVEQFQRELNKQNEIFEITIFSNLLIFFLAPSSNLFLYSGNNFPQKSPPPWHNSPQKSP